MPFSKRQLTWSEEVFAGLVILALLIAAVVLWFMHASSPPVIQTVEQPGPTNIATMSAQEREQSADAMATELAGESSPGPLTNEERIDAGNEPSQ